MKVNYGSRSKKRRPSVRETAPAYGALEIGSGSTSRTHAIAAGEFKARCLALMDDVHDRGSEYVITKRGIPIARLVPVQVTRRPLLGSMKGTAKTIGDIVSPVGEPWDALDGFDDGE